MLNSTVEAQLEAKRVDEAKLRDDQAALESKLQKAEADKKEAEEGHSLMMNPMIIENRQLTTGFNKLEDTYQTRFAAQLMPVMMKGFEEEGRPAKQQPHHYVKYLGEVQYWESVYELGLPQDDMTWTTWNAFGDESVVTKNVITSRETGEAVGFKEAFAAELRETYGPKKADKIVKLLLKMYKEYTGCRRSNKYAVCKAFWHKSADRELTAEEKAELFLELSFAT